MPFSLTVDAPFEVQLASLRAGAGVRALGDRVLVVRGEDRSSWLSGMVTNDIKALAVGDSRYTAIVQVKGKILADAWIVALADALWIVLPAETLGAVRAHLESFVVMEDIELDAPTNVTVLSVQGPAAMPDALRAEGLTVWPADRLGRGGVDVCVTEGDRPGVMRAITTMQATVVTDAAWDAARLECGRPAFGVDFGTEHYVQEANLTPRAVSFHKGCYVGQEVVCRLEMRGHVRRQLSPLVVDGEPPRAGVEVHHGGAAIGTITSSAVCSVPGKSVALAMLKWDAVQEGSAVDVAGHAATVRARPVA